MDWFVYILKCSDNSFYTGITTNTQRRLKEHNSKRGSKYLLGKLPAYLVYEEKSIDRSSASIRELEIKSWPREKKLKLVKYGLELH